MAITNGYADLTDLKAWLNIDDSNDDSILEMCITTASRAIDDLCGRRFYVDAGSGSKDFFVGRRGELVDFEDFVVASGISVTVDLTGAGSFSTAWTSNSQYIVHPVNRERHGCSNWPGEELRTLSGSTFPLTYTGRPTVRVNATWGWAAIPDAVTHACLMQAARFYRRQQTPEGIAAGDQFGAIRVSNKVDPDVAQLLAPFRKGGEAAGLVVA